MSTHNAADIDKEQVPEPHNTFERPWVYYTYMVHEGATCAAPGCGLLAHVGLIEMDEENIEKWETQEGEVEGEMVYWCALDYANAISGEAPEPEPATESEPRTMTEEEMMEDWGGEDG